MAAGKGGAADPLQGSLPPETSLGHAGHQETWGAVD